MTSFFEFIFSWLFSLCFFQAVFPIKMNREKNPKQSKILTDIHRHKNVPTKYTYVHSQQVKRPIQFSAFFLQKVWVKCELNFNYVSKFQKFQTCAKTGN
jgi:hypothetical protein